MYRHIFGAGRIDGLELLIACSSGDLLTPDESTHAVARGRVTHLEGFRIRGHIFFIPERNLNTVVGAGQFGRNEVLRRIGVVSKAEAGVAGVGVAGGVTCIACTVDHLPATEGASILEALGEGDGRGATGSAAADSHRFGVATATVDHHAEGVGCVGAEVVKDIESVGDVALLQSVVGAVAGHRVGGAAVERVHPAEGDALVAHTIDSHAANAQAGGYLVDVDIVELADKLRAIGQPSHTVVLGGTEVGSIELILGPAAATDLHQGNEGAGVAGVRDDAGLDPATANIGPEAAVDIVASRIHRGTDHEVIVLRRSTLQIHGILTAGGVVTGTTWPLVDRGVGAGMHGAIPAGIPGTIKSGVLKVDEDRQAHGAAGGAEGAAQGDGVVAGRAVDLHGVVVYGVGIEAGEGSRVACGGLGEGIVGVAVGPIGDGVAGAAVQGVHPGNDGAVAVNGAHAIALNGRAGHRRAAGEGEGKLGHEVAGRGTDAGDIRIAIALHAGARSTDTVEGGGGIAGAHRSLRHLNQQVAAVVGVGAGERDGHLIVGDAHRAGVDRRGGAHIGEGRQCGGGGFHHLHLKGAVQTHRCLAGVERQAGDAAAVHVDGVHRSGDVGRRIDNLTAQVGIGIVAVDGHIGVGRRAVGHGQRVLRARDPR